MANTHSASWESAPAEPDASDQNPPEREQPKHERAPRKNKSTDSAKPEGGKIQSVAVQWEKEKDLSTRLVALIVENKEIRRNLYPGSNETSPPTAKGGGTAKTNYYWQLTLGLFKDHPVYGPQIVQAIVGGKGWGKWEDKIKNRLDKAQSPSPLDTDSKDSLPETILVTTRAKTKPPKCSRDNVPVSAAPAIKKHKTSNSSSVAALKTLNKVKLTWEETKVKVMELKFKLKQEKMVLRSEQQEERNKMMLRMMELKYPQHQPGQGQGQQSLGPGARSMGTFPQPSHPQGFSTNPFMGGITEGDQSWNMGGSAEASQS
ncbi:hypothetical protein AAF712_008185 [Marasmius tenuissimus]|uniref:Uncharacterized protein n=1 Tax=Marasmius tenuissimus TaxID=585030 RepID=A0ABR2ZVH9_9AGAR